ncbi:hypothetical protein GO308_17820 [Sphingomonas sp. SFZ2018-12]|uniref:hypothetical protein n=1 Tax=Sphingomonas sp. SFZ2018-12 TaxID=2683197 RepID=UPI001F0E7BE6|nr:hypothetical protein [Sphingomonas sp. SFZ2018-12]MCH4894964.1 hypothetical protein [Sphingomonas sp. SFZ2018-12]
MNVWLFSGAQGLSALTVDGDGGNLPDELGPWSKVRAVELQNDTPDEQEAIALIGEHGFCCFD